VETDDRMPDCLEHPLHLVLAPLVEDELDTARCKQSRRRRRGETVLELDPFA
jgi:hypothetical protein